MKPPRLRQFRPEHGEEPQTIYLNDKPMAGMEAALLGLSNSDAPCRTNSQIETSMRGVAAIRAALEAAAGKSVEEQSREAAAGNRPKHNRMAAGGY